MEIDYSKYSLADLINIKQNIDPDVAPDNYQNLLAELEARKPELVALKEKIAEDSVNRTFRRIKALAYLQIVGAVVITYFFISGIMADPAIFLSFSALVPLFVIALSFLAGYFLLKNTALGYNLSYLNQVLQIVNFNFDTYIYEYASLGGIFFTIHQDSRFEFSANFNPGLHIAIDAVQTSGTVSFDLLVLFFIAVILTAERLREQDQSSGDANTNR